MSQTLDRGLQILEFIGERPRHVREVAEFLDVHHSTALRFLHTLSRHGFVYGLPDHSYRLGSALFRLAYRALDGIELRSVARPYIEALSAAAQETVHLGSLEHNDVVYIDKVEAPHRVRLVSRIGAVASLHSSGVAKAILSQLPEHEVHRLLSTREIVLHTPRTLPDIEAIIDDIKLSRERGYALDDEENEPGIHCVAAPIFSGAAQVVGAISVTAPISRIDRETLLGLVPQLLEATSNTSRQLGWDG